MSHQPAFLNDEFYEKKLLPLSKLWHQEPACAQLRDVAVAMAGVTLTRALEIAAEPQIADSDSVEDSTEEEPNPSADDQHGPSVHDDSTGVDTPMHDDMTVEEIPQEETQEETQAADTEVMDFDMIDSPTPTAATAAETLLANQQWLAAAEQESQDAQDAMDLVQVEKEEKALGAMTTSLMTPQPKFEGKRSVNWSRYALPKAAKHAEGDDVSISSAMSSATQLELEKLREEHRLAVMDKEVAKALTEAADLERAIAAQQLQSALAEIQRLTSIQASVSNSAFPTPLLALPSSTVAPPFLNDFIELANQEEQTRAQQAVEHEEFFAEEKQREADAFSRLTPEEQSAFEEFQCSSPMEQHELLAQREKLLAEQKEEVERVAEEQRLYAEATRTSQTSTLNEVSTFEETAGNPPSDESIPEGVNSMSFTDEPVGVNPDLAIHASSMPYYDVFIAALSTLYIGV